jgi:acetolactate synthase-1/2/3 large subunit
MTAADLLVRRLLANDVRLIFGYPGGQLTPVYDSLARTPALRHVLARHEQASTFMADGYARATGKPGVCLAVCGPGVNNASSALATAYTDSIPMVLISGQVPSTAKGLRSGYYHENEQLSACSTFTKAQLRAHRPEEIEPLIDQALATAMFGRPGPVILEVPVDVLRDEVGSPAPTKLLPVVPPAAPTATEVTALAEIVGKWKRPLILAGGGVVSAGAEAALVNVAERLGAPVLHTLMGKHAIRSDHPLARGLTWQRATSDLSNMGPLMSPLVAQADGVLAIGCRFAQGATGSWTLPIPPALAHVDIDAAELGRHYPVQVGVAADARLTLEALAAQLPLEKRQPWAPPPDPRELWRLPGVELLGSLRRRLPADGIVTADATRLAYILLADFPITSPRSFLHPAGYITMGFAIPAALGAKAAFPNRAVVAVVGDGCFMMSGLELASAIQEKLPIVVVLINDRCLSLIKATQERRYESRFYSVDLVNPDFGQFAAAFGAKYWQVTDDAAFDIALAQALDCGVPSVVEVQLG